MFLNEIKHLSNTYGNTPIIFCQFLQRITFVVVLLFYVHGKHLRSCRDS